MNPKTCYTGHVTYWWLLHTDPWWLQVGTANVWSVLVCGNSQKIKEKRKQKTENRKHKEIRSKDKSDGYNHRRMGRFFFVLIVPFVSACSPFVSACWRITRLLSSIDIQPYKLTMWGCTETWRVYRLAAFVHLPRTSTCTTICTATDLEHSSTGCLKLMYNSRLKKQRRIGRSSRSDDTRMDYIFFSIFTKYVTGLLLMWYKKRWTSVNKAQPRWPYLYFCRTNAHFCIQENTLHQAATTNGCSSESCLRLGFV